MQEKMKQFEEYAKENEIPIIEKDSLNYICSIIEEQKLYNILEIGTAIGYSAINFASVNEKIRVTSVERDRKRYLSAIQNIKEFEKDKQITLVFSDALNLMLKEKYDLIFIDAAKSQNLKFLNKFKFNLKEKGYIIIDNLGFHGLVGKSETIDSKNLKSLVKNIEEFIEYLNDQKEFEVEYIKTGDILGVLKKKE